MGVWKYAITVKPPDLALCACRAHCDTMGREVAFLLAHPHACYMSVPDLAACVHAGPMLERDGREFNERWGYLSRAGLNDKSQFTRQIEKYADIYTSRVSNFLRYTPYSYFR